MTFKNQISDAGPAYWGKNDRKENSVIELNLAHFSNPA
jgi:hypothetical protein